MATIGRKGFWATVYRHWSGDARAFVNYLIGLGIAATDPVPENRAFEHDREKLRTRALSGQLHYLPTSWRPQSDSGDFPPPPPRVVRGPDGFERACFEAARRARPVQPALADDWDEGLL